jgi:hypothetical protein
MTAKLRLPDPRVLILAVALALIVPATADARIVFPDGDVEREGLGDSGTTVQWAAPRVEGGGTPTGTPGCSPKSGSAFPTGTTEVECFASVKVCQLVPVGVCVIQLQKGTFSVTVTSGAGPQLSGLADRSATADPGRDSAIVSYPLPLASDPSGVAPGSVACTPGPGADFAVGQTTVTCSARDTVGNESAASFRVDVARAPAPTPADPATPPAPVAPAAPGSSVPPPGAATSEVPRTARAVALGRRLRIARGFARVAVSCPAANPAPCRGALKLQTTGRRKLSLGRARFALDAGRKGTVRVRLGRAARRALAGRRGKVALRAIATTSDEAGRPLSITRSFKVPR